MPERATVHVPVLKDPILAAVGGLEPRALADGTLGGGGHALALAELLPPGGKLLAVDRDPAAVMRFETLRAELARTLSAGTDSAGTQSAGQRPMPPVEWWVRCGSYEDLPRVVEEAGQPPLDAILLDLGLSSDQLADESRGFSFKADGPLDLRFNPEEGEPAWRLLERLPEGQLADVLYQYGDERFSRRIAKQIVLRRRGEPVRTAGELREVIRRCVPGGRHGRIDPATRSFQALRIAVNDELQVLQRSMQSLPHCLRAGGLLLVISFHSLEDRIVKNAFREHELLEIVTKKPIVADDRETRLNPRSRSAKLRIARRVEEQGDG